MRRYTRAEDTMVCRRSAVVLATIALALAPRGLDASDALRVQVAPAVQRAPALLTVRVSVRADADNRLLQVAAESPDFYRSSQIPINGDQAPPLSVFEFRNLPQGQYTIRTVLVGINGRRAELVQLAKVEPQFAR
jgi:hypothetical protein